eukprot:c11784_g1_i2.p1 GENE.c11784_g1_i2~~c11784_g1_i2.p1  ORF type:complete len:456 (+),score=108.94 c11784_g1_i2:121-1488(+)
MGNKGSAPVSLVQERRPTHYAPVTLGSSLVVGVVEARDVRRSASRRISFLGKMFLYVELDYGDKHFQTSVFGEDTVEPVWKESFSFESSEVPSQTLTVRLVDSSNKQRLGEAVIELSRVDLSHAQVVEDWYSLINSPGTSGAFVSAQVFLRFQFCADATKSIVGVQRRPHCENITVDSTLNEQFMLSKLIGEGQYSAVYVGTRMHIPEGEQRLQLAMKVYKSRHYKEHKKLINDEIAVMKALDHPHTVVLREVVVAKDGVCLVMDYVPGDTLLERMTAEKMSPESARKITKQILEALVHIHGKKIIHRNLKPENIIFSSEDENAHIVIVDFATSTFYDPRHSTRLTETHGTPQYFSPEITQNHSYNHATDLWSVGVIVFSMLVGHHPFASADSDEDLYDLVVEGLCEYDEHDWAKVPVAAREFVVSLLNVDPTLRPTATEAIQHKWIREPSANWS